MDSGWRKLWYPPETSPWTWSLCLRCCSFFRWTLRSIWILGQNPSFVGFVNWKHHPTI